MFDSNKLLAICLGLILLAGIAQATTTTFNATYCAQPNRQTDSQWGDLRNGVGTAMATSNTVGFDMQAKSTNTTPWDYYYRGGCTWDTSSLGSSASISSATITGYSGYRVSDLGQPTMAWVYSAPTTPAGPYVSGDYDNIDWTRFTDSRPYSEFSTLNATITWTMTAQGLANISKVSYTTMYLEPNWTIDNQTPTWIASKEGSAQIRNTSYASGNFAPQLSVTWSAGGSAPVTAFSGTPTSGTTPLSVTFTDASTNTPTAWAWYFWANETASSTSQHPTQSFTTGVYDIRLNSSNAYGYDWENKTSIINVGNTTGTTIYATYDGRATYTPNSSFATMRNAATASTMTDPVPAGTTVPGSYWLTTNTTDEYNEHYRGLVTFDTSSVPDSSTITGATLTMYGATKSNWLGDISAGLIDASVINPVDYSTSDYSATTFTRMATDIPYASFPSANGTANFTLNSAGIAHINKTGYTVFILEDNRTIDNNPFTWAIQANAYFTYRSVAYNGGTYKPVLTLTYSSNIPSAQFSGTPTSGATPLSVTFTDASTNTPTAWAWYSTTGGTDTLFSTSASPTQSFTSGTYDIRLNASNVNGYTWMNKTSYVSVGGTFTGTKFYDVYDAYIYRATDTQWNTVRNGAGESVLTTNPTIGSDLMTTNITNTFDYHYRGGVTFNTTGIPVGATINNATITGYAYNNANYLGTTSYAWVDFNPANKTSYTAPDYSATTFTPVTDYAVDTAFYEGDIINWTVSNLSTINKGGLTSYMLESTWMINNTSPTWSSQKESYASIYGKQYYNATLLPYLTVNYTSSSGGAPAADFTSDKQWCTAPCTVQFTDLSANNPTLWYWSYSTDGISFMGAFTTESAQNPVQIFSTAGTYSIYHSVGNSQGSDYNFKYDYIVVVDEWASFTSDPSPAIVLGTTTGQNIQFIDTSVNAPKAWAWHWYNNETVSSTLQNPVGTFCVGNYSVRLKATGANITAWHNQTDYVSVGYAPTAHFSMVVV